MRREPPYDDLPAGLDAGWCFRPAPTAQVAEVAGRWESGVSHLVQGRGEIAAGTVQELYAAIADAFERLPGLFVHNPPEVVIPVEYNVLVFPVTDRQSALAAVDLIVRQGEGLQGPWTYESHFRRFYEMRQEFLALKAPDPRFDAALPLLRNPAREDVRDEFTGRVFGLVNYAYVTVLLMLTGLYARWAPEDRYPFLSTALAQMTFAPTMTTIVRSIAEVLVRLPIGSGAERTGPSFFIEDDDRELLADPRSGCFADIGFFLHRWDAMTRQLEELHGARPSDPPDPLAPGITDDLRYLHQNAHRVTANLRRIYQAGYYSKFISI
jgi:hypothetical protein